MKYLFDLDDLPPGQPLYIVGAGRGGMLLEGAIQHARRFEILGVVDSVKTGMLGGHPIIPMDRFLAERTTPSTVLIASQFVDEIAMLLDANAVTGLYDAYPFVSQLMEDEAKRQVLRSLGLAVVGAAALMLAWFGL